MLSLDNDLCAQALRRDRGLQGHSARLRFLRLQLCLWLPEEDWRLRQSWRERVCNVRLHAARELPDRGLLLAVGG
jgi:hypothetical protein